MGRFPERRPQLQSEWRRGNSHDTLRQRRLLFLFDQRRRDMERREEPDAEVEVRSYRSMDALEWRHGQRQDAVGRVLRSLIRQLRDQWLQRHHAGGRQESSHRLANNPIEAGFLGDYMWLTVDAMGRPNIVWADTRGLHGAVEEDIYFSRFSGDE
jgi:hypothetical protein